MLEALGCARVPSDRLALAGPGSIGTSDIREAMV